MNRIEEEVAVAEPPSYGNQSKPRGRKPKKSGAAVKPKKGKGSKKNKARKSKAKRVRKAGKIRKGEGEPAEADQSIQEEVEPAEVVPETKAKPAKRKAKALAKSSSAKPTSEPVPAAVAVTPGEGGSRPSLPQGMVYPPDWVKSGNVYSNSYRRAQASGKSADEIKEYAKDCTRRFRECGGVDKDLLDSFGKDKPKPRQKRGAAGASAPNPDTVELVNGNVSNEVESVA